MRSISPVAPKSSAGRWTSLPKYPGTGDNSHKGYVIFDPKQYKDRAGLLLLNHMVYTSWASHCDDRPYTGWIMSYNERTLAQQSVLNVTPNGNEGAIWGSGAGPAASVRNIYFLDANGTFDHNFECSGFPVNGDYGNAIMKLSTKNGTFGGVGLLQHVQHGERVR